MQVGLEQYNAGSYEKALEIFQKAMDLPGTGIKQFRYRHHKSYAPCPVKILGIHAR